jgi:hypothetical protein
MAWVWCEENGDGSLTLSLARFDPGTITRKRLLRARTCSEQAETVAVALAVWEAQIPDARHVARGRNYRGGVRVAAGFAMNRHRSLGAGMVLVGVSVGWLAGCGSGQPLGTDNGGLGGAGGQSSGNGGTGGGLVSGSGGGAGSGVSSAGGAAGGDPGLPAISGTGIALFDATTEGFSLDTYHDISSTTNLDDGSNPNNPPPTLTFDDTQGDPAPGSLSVFAPFSGANQYVDLQKVFGTTATQDWSGRTLHVRIKVSEGAFKGGGQLYVKTGSTYVFGGTYSALRPGTDWTEIALDIAAPMASSQAYDPHQIVSFGLQLNTGGAGVGSTPVTFSVDSFWLDPPLPSPDAGPGDAAGN